MVASILDGQAVATQIRASLMAYTAELRQNHQRPPGLAVILVGDDPASAIYVNHKVKACVAVGFHSVVERCASDITEHALLARIDSLNDREDIDGILVQLPLPAHINTQAIIERIRPDKDVDGFHPYHLGRLAQGRPLLRPCTPHGIMRLLSYYGLSCVGRHAVVIGASNIVGRPMALEFLAAKATVTICHRATTNLQAIVESAEILVVATGDRRVVCPDWLRPNQIIIDVGMHRLSNGSVCGDIDFEQAKKRVAWITPVPKGVGPMTVAMLLSNTLACHLGQFDFAV